MSGPVKFVGGSYLLNTRKADVQRAINMFPEVIESGSGKSGVILQSIPGLTEFAVAPIPNFGAKYGAINYTGDGESSRNLPCINMTPGGLVVIHSPAGGDSRAFMSTDGTSPASTDWASSGANTALGDIVFNAAGARLTSNAYNQMGVEYKAWFFQKNAGFLDVVKYTGDGTTSQAISHALGITVGRVLTRNIDGDTVSSVTRVYDINSTVTQVGGVLGSSPFSVDDPLIWANTPPTYTKFYVGGISQNNVLGVPYVAVLFAHNTTPTGEMQTVQWNGNTSTNGPTVLPGWQPQWLFTKCLDIGASFWLFEDTLTDPGFAGPTPKQFVSDTFANSNSWGSRPITLVTGGFQLTSASLDINQGHYSAVIIRAT